MTHLEEMRIATIKDLNANLIKQLTRINSVAIDLEDVNALNFALIDTVNSILAASAEKKIAELSKRAQ